MQKVVYRNRLYLVYESGNDYYVDIDDDDYGDGVGVDDGGAGVCGVSGDSNNECIHVETGHPLYRHVVKIPVRRKPVML